MTTKAESCAICGITLLHPDTGRPRIYCSDGCRRLAERRIVVATQLLARARRKEQDARHVAASGFGKEGAQWWRAEVARCAAELAALLAGRAPDSEDEAEASQAAAKLASRRRR